MKFDKWEYLRQWLQEGAEYEQLPDDQRRAYRMTLDKMKECEEIEHRFNVKEPELPTFELGDKVRHEKYKYLGTGIVKEISKSGKKAVVDFGEIDDWDKKRLHWEPYPAYYTIEKLQKILPQAIETNE